MHWSGSPRVHRKEIVVVSLGLVEKKRVGKKARRARNGKTGDTLMCMPGPSEPGWMLRQGDVLGGGHVERFGGDGSICLTRTKTSTPRTLR